MKTRAQNTSKHPAAPIMTLAQLTAAGISQPKRPQRKPTKDQRIAALEEDLRMTRELLQMDRVVGTVNSISTAPGSPDTIGDTELATDDDNDDYAVVSGRKRCPQKPVSGVRVKRSRAIDPFETKKVHSRTTGLVDNWRHKLPPTPSPSSQTVTPRKMILNLHSPRSDSATPPPPIPSLVALMEEDPLPVFQLSRMVNRQRVYPGIKDLPGHIRTDFRNMFIRPVVQDALNTKQPWLNPELAILQAAYNRIYPQYPARLRASDAVTHPTITSLHVIRSRIGTAAVFAVQRHLSSAFRQRRLQMIDSRANFVSKQFKSDDDHPFIWRQYVVRDIPNHPGTGGYQTTRRGVFQSDPILETLLIYYSSSGIMESPPIEDPGEGNRPIGALALATAAVERAYRMHSTGDYVEATQGFNAEFWGDRTALFMDYITNDLTERHWNGIFGALAAVSKRVVAEVAVETGAPPAPRERVPLPPSDPPSPSAED